MAALLISLKSHCVHFHYDGVVVAVYNAIYGTNHLEPYTTSPQAQNVDMT